MKGSTSMLRPDGFEESIVKGGGESSQADGMQRKRRWAKVEPFVADPDHRPSRAPCIFPAWRLSISVKATGANNSQTREGKPGPQLLRQKRGLLSKRPKAWRPSRAAIWWSSYATDGHASNFAWTHPRTAKRQSSGYYRRPLSQAHIRKKGFSYK